MFRKMPVHDGKNQRDDRELNQQVVEERGQSAAQTQRLSAGQQSDENDQDDSASQSKVERENLRVKRKQGWPDELAAKGETAMILPITAGNNQGISVLPEQRFHFGFVQWSAELGLAIFDLRMNIFRELPDDVVFLFTGKRAAQCFQITIEHFHGGSLQSINSKQSDADLTKIEQDLQQQKDHGRHDAPRGQTD